MTTIAYRDGVIAADSRVTVDSEGGGSRVFHCEKLFSKFIKFQGKKQNVVLAGAGEAFAAELFIQNYTGGEVEQSIKENFLVGDADFTVLLMDSAGSLYEMDRWCHFTKIKDTFYAVGSGAKAALGAMHMGADAYRAVQVACEIDPYTAPPVIYRIADGYVPPSGYANTAGPQLGHALNSFSNMQPTEAKHS